MEKFQNKGSNTNKSHEFGQETIEALFFLFERLRDKKIEQQEIEEFYASINSKTFDKFFHSLYNPSIVFNFYSYNGKLEGTSVLLKENTTQENKWEMFTIFYNQEFSKRMGDEAGFIAENSNGRLFYYHFSNFSFLSNFEVEGPYSLTASKKVSILLGEHSDLSEPVVEFKILNEALSKGFKVTLCQEAPSDLEDLFNSLPKYENYYLATYIIKNFRTTFHFHIIGEMLGIKELLSADFHQNFKVYNIDIKSDATNRDMSFRDKYMSDSLMPILSSILMEQNSKMLIEVGTNHVPYIYNKISENFGDIATLLNAPKRLQRIIEFYKKSENGAHPHIENSLNFIRENKDACYPSDIPKINKLLRDESI